MICPMTCDMKCISLMYNFGVNISLFCVFISVLISSYLIYQHLQNFNLPYFQSKIIIILMMAPFYGLISITSLEFPGLAAYLELVRDIYLAFLLFTFFYLMFSYMAYDPDTKTVTDDRVYITMMQHEQVIHHLWPVNYCTNIYLLNTKAKAKYFTYRCKKWILQYFVLKPVLTIFLLIIHPFMMTKIINIIANVLDLIIVISESFSLYYLILFYYALRQPLKPYKPLLKFLIIKITLFFTFWQSLTLSLFREQISECFEPDNIEFTNEFILSSIENTLVCFEMLGMTIACIWAFTYLDFSETDSRRGNLSEVFSDNWSAFKHDFRLIKPKKFGFTSKVHNVEHEMTERLSRNDEYEIDLQEYPRLSKAVKITYM